MALDRTAHCRVPEGQPETEEVTASVGDDVTRCERLTVSTFARGSGMFQGAAGVYSSIITYIYRRQEKTREDGSFVDEGFEVKAISGNTQRSGATFENRIVDFCLQIQSLNRGVA